MTFTSANHMRAKVRPLPPEEPRCVNEGRLSQDALGFVEDGPFHKRFERVHQHVLDRPILTARDQTGERGRNHPLLDSLDQPPPALFDQSDVMPSVLGAPSSYRDDLLVCRAFVVQILQFPCEFHGTGPAACL